MENKLQYRSTIKSRPYFYIEMKQLAELVLQGLNELELRNKVIDKNVFQVNTESRKREIASTLLNRLNVLDQYLIKQLIQSDVATSKLIALFSIIKTDRLFFEFMHEVLYEKLLYQDSVITDRDFNIFFESKRQQSKRVSNWTEYTFYKLKQVYIRILFESGLLESQKQPRKIIKPIINPDVLKHIRNHDNPKFINVIVGG